MASQGQSCFQRSSVHILLSDKDVMARMEVYDLLRRCSYKVTAVENTRQVLQFLKTGSSSVDIVLADVEAQDRKSFKILKEIMNEESFKQIPIIMMSSQDEMPLVVRCLRLGALDFLVKPLRTNELLNLWTHMWRRRKMLGLTMRQGNGQSDISDSLLSAYTDTGDSNSGSLDALSDGKHARQEPIEQCVWEGRGCEGMERAAETQPFADLMGSPRLELSLKPASDTHDPRKDATLFKPKDSLKLGTLSPLSAFNQYPVCNRKVNCARLRGGDASAMGSQPQPSSRGDTRGDVELVPLPFMPAFGAQLGPVPESSRGPLDTLSCPPSTSYQAPKARRVLENTPPRTSDSGRVPWSSLHRSPSQQEPSKDPLPGGLHREASLGHHRAPFTSHPLASLPLIPGLLPHHPGTQHPLLPGGIPPMLHPAGFGLPQPLSIFGLHPEGSHMAPLHRSGLPPGHMLPPSHLLGPFPPFFPGVLPPPQVLPPSSRPPSQGPPSGAPNANPPTTTAGWPTPPLQTAKERKVEAAERRGAALTKFRQKRKDRCFEKKIRYVSRKKLAESRPRVKGQFVRRDLVASGEDEEEEEEEEDDEDSSEGLEGESVQGTDLSPEMYTGVLPAENVVCGC